MRIGAHVTVAKGYDSTLEYALEVGCETLQIFSHSPRQWRTMPIEVEDADRFAAARDEVSVGPLVIHTMYLINLGSEDATLWERSVDGLAEELRRGAAMHAEIVVTHIGTRFGGDDKSAANRVADGIERAWDLAGPSSRTTRLALENTAGAGRTFGSTFEQLGAVTRLLDERDVPPTGICFDTCHGWAAGYDVSSTEGWTRVVHGIDSACGADRLLAIHANDTEYALGSKKDRHAWIGDGLIGNEGFAAMLCEPRLVGVPAIMEMPGEPPFKDAENIRRLKRLRAACGGDGSQA